MRPSPIPAHSCGAATAQHAVLLPAPASYPGPVRPDAWPDRSAPDGRRAKALFMILVDNDQMGACAKSENEACPPGCGGVEPGWSPASLMMAATARGVESVMVTWMVTWCMFFL